VGGGGKGKEIRATRIVTISPGETQEGLLTEEEFRAAIQM